MHPGIACFALLARRGERALPDVVAQASADFADDLGAGDAAAFRLLRDDVEDMPLRVGQRRRRLPCIKGNRKRLDGASVKPVTAAGLPPPPVLKPAG